MKLLDYLPPMAAMVVLYTLFKVIMHRRGDTRISMNLGMLHQLLQLNPDDHTVSWEDGTESSVPDAIDYYLEQLIEELRV